MQIEKNKVVQIHYTAADAAGRLIDDSRQRGPMEFLVGASNIVWGLEQALLGRAKGDQIQVSVRPEDGYGTRDPKDVLRIPIKRLGREVRKVRTGDSVVLDSGRGKRRGTIRKVGRYHVDVDFNHPLAGVALSFNVEVLDIRDATAEEIRHGHVHGPQGCGA